MATSDYPTSGVSLVADLSQYTSQMESAIALAERFDDLAGQEHVINVSAEVDTSALSGLDDLPLDGETVNFTVDVTETGDDIADLPKDGETVNTTVNAEPSEVTKKVIEFVGTVKDKVIETTWNLVGSGVDIIKNIGGDAISNIIDLDTELGRLKATTGETIPNARELITNIFYDDLGDSITQVGNVIAKAQQLKLPLDEASRAALAFTKVFDAQDPERVLNTLSQLVNNKLVPDFTTAGNLLTVAFQQGANKAGDLLTVLEKNSTAIHDLGLNGPEAISFIKTGMDNGYTSATQVLDTLTKIKQNITNASGNANSDVTKTLNILGIANPVDTGQAWSADFFKQVIEGIKNAPVSDTEKQAMFQNLVGGKIGAKTFSSFLALSPDQADEILAALPDAAARAASDIDDSLTGALGDFRLEIEKRFNEFLTSDAVDLPGKITLLKEGLQAAMDSLAKGGTLGEALTIALKPIGFDDEFQGLEAALGNFVIGILQAVTQLQTLTGHGQEAEGTQMTIHKLAQQQLAFDLKIGNPDEIANTLATAASRGVTPENILKSASTAVEELISEGATGTAQNIIDTLKQQANTGVQLQLLPGLDENSKQLAAQQLEGLGLGHLNSDGSITMALTPEMTPEAIQGMADTIVSTVTGNFGSQLVSKVDVKPTIGTQQIDELQKQLDQALAKTNPTMDEATKTITNAQKPIEDFSTGVGSVRQRMDEAKPKIDALAQGTDKLGGQAKKASDTVPKAADAIQGVSDSASSAVGSLQDMATAIDDIVAKAYSVSDAADDLAKKNANGNTGTGGEAPNGGGASGGTDFSGTFWVGENGPEIMTTNRDVSILNNMTSEAIMAALSGYIPGGSITHNNGGNVFNAISYNTVQNTPQADAVGFQQAKVLRGMAAGMN